MWGSPARTPRSCRVQVSTIHPLVLPDGVPGPAIVQPIVQRRTSDVGSHGVAPSKHRRQAPLFVSKILETRHQPALPTPVFEGPDVLGSGENPTSPRFSTVRGEPHGRFGTVWGSTRNHERDGAYLVTSVTSGRSTVTQSDQHDHQKSIDVDVMQLRFNVYPSPIVCCSRTPLTQRTQLINIT